MHSISDTDGLLRALGDLPVGEKAYVIGEVGLCVGAQSKYTVKAELPTSNRTWEIIAAIRHLQQHDYPALTAIAVRMAMAGLLEQTQNPSKPSAETSEIGATFESNGDQTTKHHLAKATNSPVLNESAVIDHFLSVQGGLSDIDNLVLACRRVELTQGVDQYPVKLIRAALVHPMTNPDATLASIVRKAEGVREIDDVMDASPKSYKLTKCGRDRIKTLRELIPS